MRTDARIDGRQVRVPKASHLGYDKWVAQVGDWVHWTYPEGGLSEMGRMIGRIHYAPALGESPEIKDWIEVLTLSGVTHAYPRWVNPEWVTQVHANAPDIANFLGWFCGELPERDRCVGMAEYGALSPNQEPTMPSWDFAVRLERYQEYRERAKREYHEDTDPTARLLAGKVSK